MFPVSPCPWQVVEEAKLELKRRREEGDKERETCVRNIGAESVSKWFCLCGVCPSTGVYNYDVIRRICSYSRGGMVACQQYFVVDYRREVYGTHSAGTVGIIFLLLFASTGVCGGPYVLVVRFCWNSEP